MWYSVYPNELCHYGILGQKWGVRRFQNPDGSLTSTGRMRYSKNGRIFASKTKATDGSIHKTIRVTKGDDIKYERHTNITVDREKKEKTVDGKKIAVAVGATVAAAVATGLAIKYRKEIGAAVNSLKGKASAKVVDKMADSIVSDDKKLAGILLSSPGELAKGFGKEQMSRIGKAAEKGMETSLQALFTAPLTVAAGYATSKIASKAAKAKQEKGQSYVRDVMTTVGNKGLNSFKSSLDNTQGGKNKGGNNNGGNGKGLNLNDKETKDRYDRLMQQHPDKKEQIRKLRQEVTSVDELEKRLEG